MSEGGDTSIEAESIDKDIFNVIRLDWLQVPIKSSLGDNDDRLSLSDRSVLLSAPYIFTQESDLQILEGYTFPTPNRPKRVGSRG